MENKNLHFKGFGIIKDAQVKVELKELKLYLKFDSNEKIYQLKYLTDNTLIANLISSNIDFFENLSVSTSHELFLHPYKDLPHVDILSFVQRAFIVAFKDYVGDPGALTDQDESVDRDILCHCAKLSKARFIQEFKKNTGNVKKTVFETLAKSFCETCDFEVDALIKQLEGQGEFFLGASKSIWIDKINKLIEEFYLFCPPEYNKISFEIKALKYNKLILSCDKSGSNLSRSEIQATMSNYLGGEIDEDIVVSVIT